MGIIHVTHSHLHKRSALCNAEYVTHSNKSLLPFNNFILNISINASSQHARDFHQRVGSDQPGGSDISLPGMTFLM